MYDVREELLEICDTNNGWVDEVPVEDFVDYLMSEGVTIERHEYWICEGNTSLGHPKCVCSGCRYTIGVTRKAPNYCPECGANMKH